MAHGTLPKRKNVVKRDRFDELVDNMISYMCIAAGATRLLADKGKLSPKLNFKLMNDVEFCGNLLENFMGIEKNFIIKGHNMCMTNPKYKEEVNKLCEVFVPGSTEDDKAFKLYTDADFTNAIINEKAKNRALKNMKKGGGLIRR